MGFVTNTDGEKQLFGPVTDGLWGYACLAGASAVQAIPAATTTTITYNTDIHDPAGFHDTVTNNNRLTIPYGLDGNYMVGGSGQSSYHATTMTASFSVFSLQGTGGAIDATVRYGNHEQSSLGTGVNYIMSFTVAGLFTDMTAGNFFSSTVWIGQAVNWGYPTPTNKKMFWCVKVG